ncbi:MAG: hypothetical protein GY932_08730 [Arcobacter sp.]|nr:hypothetical protein [Arcobacter sp.]
MEHIKLRVHCFFIDYLMPIGNHYGIFKSKKAKMLAINYGLDLNNKFAYGKSADDKNLITFNDVIWICENLWRSHFTYGMPPPIIVDDYDYIMWKNIVG